MITITSTVTIYPSVTTYPRVFHEMPAPDPLCRECAKYTGGCSFHCPSSYVIVPRPQRLMSYALAPQPPMVLTSNADWRWM